ncbi:hypothetical protein CEXT_662291 [Caerostris extrusa]|uniref:Uncharacterized protein n=1 Tax=Caerostris extrusa TaxID=172846 RepID=A0AAV4NBZ2_CAEEX|nr:hypothetical protein CEXT_662291 [Caerostris extrusa]
MLQPLTLWPQMNHHGILTYNFRKVNGAPIYDSRIIFGIFNSLPYRVECTQNHFPPAYILRGYKSGIYPINMHPANPATPLWVGDKKVGACRLRGNNVAPGRRIHDG